MAAPARGGRWGLVLGLALLAAGLVGVGVVGVWVIADDDSTTTTVSRAPWPCTARAHRGWSPTTSPARPRPSASTRSRSASSAGGRRRTPCAASTSSSRRACGTSRTRTRRSCSNRPVIGPRSAPHPIRRSCARCRTSSSSPTRRPIHPTPRPQPASRAGARACRAPRRRVVDGGPRAERRRAAVSLRPRDPVRLQPAGRPDTGGHVDPRLRRGHDRGAVRHRRRPRRPGAQVDRTRRRRSTPGPEPPPTVGPCARSPSTTVI